MDDLERKQIEELSRRLEALSQDLTWHFERVQDAGAVLGKWVEWARIHDHSNHAKGLIEETLRMIKP